MIDSLIIITKTLAKHLYGFNTYEVTDFEKKKKSHSIIGIIEINDNNLHNIKAPKDFNIRFDYMKGYEEEAYRLLEMARDLIKKYNIPDNISIFDESGNIRKIIEKEYSTQ